MAMAATCQVPWDVASQGRSLIGFAERSRTPVVFAQFLVVPGVMLTLSDTVP